MMTLEPLHSSDEEEAWKRKVSVLDASLRVLRESPKSAGNTPKARRQEGTPKGRGLLSFLRTKTPAQDLLPPG